MTKEALEKKALQSQVVFDNLIEKYGINPVPTYFVADPGRKPMFLKACIKDNPFPFPFSMILANLRKESVDKIFKDEIILQTPAIAAVLAASSSVATEIGALRGDDVSGAETYCDVAYSGMQAIRLYMMGHDGWKFRIGRLKSTIKVYNAFNGVFYKYPTRDGRDFSFHVYRQDQQAELVNGLGVSKASPDYTFMSLAKDKKEIGNLVKNRDALELEEHTFESGACGCMIRTREEWEATDVGNAVCNQPLIDEVKETEGDIPNWGKPNSRGPLSGIKVLDLTHIIAGPACARMLAEYGADVLLVRRGTFMEQEQKMIELDGWAGKHSIQLDFNNPSELEKCKELIKKADVITYSYQNGSMDKFGLSEEDIRKLNPNVIYSNLNCFSETVWRHRPGWAPCAEDMTGLSVRNGSLEKPVNLNGVPLDYFPGFILGLGTLLAIKHKLENGGGYKVTTSLTRGAQYLHECTDLCNEVLGDNEHTSCEDCTCPVCGIIKKIAPAKFENNTSCMCKLPSGIHDHLHTMHAKMHGMAPKANYSSPYSSIVKKCNAPIWDDMLNFVYVDAVGGKVGFPGPGTVNTAYPKNAKNLIFTDGNTGWRQH